MTDIMKKLTRKLALAGLLLALPDIAGAGNEDVADFLSPRGCVIGPGTAEAAKAAGIGAPVLNEFAAQAASLPGSYRTGEWLVVSSDLCRITIPPIDSELTLDDPEVKASFTDKDAHADTGFHGCFLDDSVLWEKLHASRGWSREHAFSAYLRLVGAGVRSGALSFHSTDEARPAPGFVLTTGTCGDVPGMAAIRADHALLMEHLDALIRNVATVTRCNEGDVPANFDDPGFMARLTGGKYRNAWGWWNLMAMGMAAGWYEGTSLTRNGMPLPPLCRFPAG